MAKTSKAYAAERRKKARAAGLCITCGKIHPAKNRVVCQRCTTSARDRVLRRRAKLRQREELQQIVKAHERMGDMAREHHLHEDATQHYQDALNVQIVAQEDRLRLSEKLAYTLSLGRNPNAYC
jgi:hypothetical protein